MVIALSLLIAVLLVVILTQIARASELSGEINDEPLHSEESSRVHGYLLLIFLIGGMIGVVYCFLHFDHFLFPVSASEHGKQIDWMFNITLLFTGVVFVITNVLLFYFAFRYYERKDGKAKYFPHNTKLEVMWTVIPSIVLTVLVIGGLRTWLGIFEKAPEDSLVIEINAKQFQWVPRYGGADETLGTRQFANVMKYEDVNPDFINELGIDWDNPASFDDVVQPTEIHVVVNRPVQFKLHALDVLHSFYLPFFRVKMDCVPGVPTGFWMVPTITTDSMRVILKDHSPYWREISEKTGRPRYETFNYELACAELCGRSHWNMRMTLIVETQEEFDAWLAEQPPYYETVVAAALNRDIPVKDAAPEQPDSLGAAADTAAIGMIVPVGNTGGNLKSQGK